MSGDPARTRDPSEELTKTWRQYRIYAATARKYQTRWRTLLLIALILGAVGALLAGLADNTAHWLLQEDLQVSLAKNT